MVFAYHTKCPLSLFFIEYLLVGCVLLYEDFRLPSSATAWLKVFLTLVIAKSFTTLVQFVAMHFIVLASLMATVVAAANQTKASLLHQGSFKLSLNRRETGNDTAWNRGPIWETAITIGAQEFTVWIDTGSADL